METTYQLSPTCSCGHQLILAPGSTCDICMGIVSESSIGEEKDWYGLDYFDALETEMSKAGMAA